MDILATMTPAEFQAVKTQLQAEGLWHGGAGTPAQERAANQRAEQIIQARRN